MADPHQKMPMLRQLLGIKLHQLLGNDTFFFSKNERLLTNALCQVTSLGPWQHEVLCGEREGAGSPGLQGGML